VVYIPDPETTVLSVSDTNRSDYTFTILSLLNKVNIDKIFIDKYNPGISYHLKIISEIEGTLRATIQYILLILAVLIWVTIGYYFIRKKELEDSVILQKNTKTFLEGKTQYIVAGRMYHETLGPITLISDLFKEITDHILPKCMDCNQRGVVHSEAGCIENKKDLDSYSDNIVTALSRLTSVLTLLKDSKANRYSNGNKNIYDLTTNLLATSTFFIPRKIEYELKNGDILKDLHLAKLQNGLFINNLSNLITNSAEAECDTIYIECKLLEPDKLMLLVGDNGRGVRNKHDKIIGSDMYDSIFEYGASNKDPDGNQIKLEDGEEEPSDTTANSRGLGMFIIRKTFNDNGCSIRLANTNENGTVFEIIIEVEPFEG